jgi:hypothetical protein
MSRYRRHLDFTLSASHRLDPDIRDRRAPWISKELKPGFIFVQETGRHYGLAVSRPAQNGGARLPFVAEGEFLSPRSPRSGVHGCL